MNKIDKWKEDLKKILEYHKPVEVLTVIQEHCLETIEELSYDEEITLWDETACILSKTVSELKEIW